ncbi:glycosyltransferase family 4 protein [Chitinophaga sancti]|uniref:glycosyltransferase family 4 protein n=1 Tax=Chitinophaga sancti TaxID=1004 RepID=UPI003F78BE4A
MKNLIIELFPTLVLSLISVSVCFPVMIKLSSKLGLVDRPNDRKVHYKPIPAIGGLVITMSLIPVLIYNPALPALLKEHKVIAISMLILMVTGLLDDRFGLSPRIRLLIQAGCATWAAMSGYNISSLHGIMGIGHIPTIISWILTAIIITGVTNAFNLIDGIDGLAGSLSLANIIVLGLVAVFIDQEKWLALLLPMAIGLLIFLKYNWRPAKVFMGDSGSLLFGFLTTVIGIHFINASSGLSKEDGEVVTVIVSACCMIPVIDSLRVFYGRMKKGNSPFKADKTHLHHIFLKLHLAHTIATKRLLNLHIVLILLSVIGLKWFTLPWIILGQIAGTFLYISGVRIMSYFQRWYRFLKLQEMSN